MVALLPNRALFRVNLALYAAQAGDFQFGEEEARRAVALGSPLGLLPLAFSQLALGQSDQAAQTYQELGEMGAFGASFAAFGLGDLALYEGRFTEAAEILEDGAAADLVAGSPDAAAAGPDGRRGRGRRTRAGTQ